MENLGIDPKLLIAQIINFILFFFIVKKFIAKPFIQFINNEKNKEKEKEKLLNDLKKSEEAFIFKEKEMKTKMKREINETITEAKKEASDLKKELMKQAEQEVQEMMLKSKEQLEQERIALYSEIKKKVVDLSVLIVNQALIDSLDEEMKKKVTAKIIEKASLDLRIKI
jgi:F-type H+-transporting ATPase subunit b